MTEAEAIKKLEEFEQLSEVDAEAAHCKADALVSNFLREHGYSDLADTYDEVSEGFWYA